MRDLFSSFGWYEGVRGVYSSPGGKYTIDINSKMLVNPDGYVEYLTRVDGILVEALTNMERRIRLLER